MSGDLERCVVCQGRGYTYCACWPGDCICGCGDQTCENCEGEGYFEPFEDDYCEPMMCQACEAGDHDQCGMQTWCQCDCEGYQGPLIIELPADHPAFKKVDNVEASKDD